jgi:hypothetical protein
MLIAHYTNTPWTCQLTVTTFCNLQKDRVQTAEDLVQWGTEVKGGFSMHMHKRTESSA